MDTHFITIPGAIRSNFAGFVRVADLAAQLARFEFHSIRIDMSQVRWLDANMCAPLGAVLYKVSRSLNELELVGVAEKVERSLSRNGFLSSYGHSPIQDHFDSTIQYQRFEPTDHLVFSLYLDGQLEGRGLPAMTPALHRRFVEGLLEIFNNAVTHSQTHYGIFACGQYFPRQNLLKFTLADLGIGISANLRNTLGLNLSPEAAIDWAMQGNNTTKRGAIPGGLGLKLLREFIALNQGRIQVASDRGYWEQTPQGQIHKRCFTHPFPGTAVNIEINSADLKSYLPDTQHISDDIF